jgi:hypothetical protein
MYIQAVKVVIVLIGQNAQVNMIRPSAVSQKKKKKGGHMPTALVVNLLKLENIAACGICCCPKWSSSYINIMQSKPYSSHVASSTGTTE